MVPKDRREELTGDQRDQVGGLGRRPARRRHDRDQDEDRAEQLDEPGGVGAQAELIGDRTRREVVRGRDRVADLSDEGDEVGPCSDPGEQRRRNGEDREGDGAHRDSAVASGQERPDEDEPRLELDRRTKGAAQAQAEGIVQPSPADREAQEQERSHLAELHGIREWPGQTGQQNGPPADGRRDRHERDTDEERGDEQGGPGPDRGRRREEPERQDERDERRRVVEEPEAATRLEGQVVDRCACQHASRRLVVGEEVEAEGVAGGGDRRPDDRTEDEDRDDRQCRSGQASRLERSGHEDRRAPRPSARWISGIRNRSHATRTARPGRARIREPRRSSQRIGTIAIR